MDALLSKENVWEEFHKREKELFYFVNGKKVVMWGYGQNGYFLEHLFKKNNKMLEYIVDDSPYIHRKLRIYRSFILQYMDKDTHVIILTFRRNENVIHYLEALGYVEGKNYIFIRDLFYKEIKTERTLSYYDWLEYRNDLDVITMRSLEEISFPNSDCFYYSPTIDYALINVCDQFSFCQKDRIFDFGCGKGGALLLFYKSGLKHLGGVEYDKDLFDIARANLKKMGIDESGLIHGDAASVESALDDYNYFFAYNPFQGKTFDKVIQNIEESYRRRKRKITFLYSGTYCHHKVIENHLFKLSKEIDTDCDVRIVNVYTINGE